MALNELRVGTLAAAPGTKAVGIQELLIDGRPVRFPIFAIHGAEPGITVAITAGIHGAEYASVAAALHVGQTLSADHLRGRVIIAPVANPPAFQARSIYVCPLDNKNLNRVFPGDEQGTASEQIAHWLFKNVIEQADYYIDMHGGDLVEALVPFTIFHHSGNEAVDNASLELAQVYGIPYLVRSESTGSTFSAAAEAGIPAILPEAGGQGIWRPEDVQAHVDGLHRVFRHFDIVRGPRLDPVPSVILERFIWLRSDHDGYYYPTVGVGDTVSEGQAIGEVRDFAGNVLQPVTSPTCGRVLFLVSSLAINQGDPLISIGA